jgi:hypothetical protein
MQKYLLSAFLILAAVAFSAGDASAKALTRAEADNLCKGRAKLTCAGCHGCTWCDKTGVFKRCYSVNCDSKGCTLTVVRKIFGGADTSPSDRR